jgi:hypothetical protein
MFFVHFVVLENIGKRNNLHYPIKRWSGDQKLRKNNGMLRHVGLEKQICECKSKIDESDFLWYNLNSICVILQNVEISAKRRVFLSSYGGKRCASATGRYGSCLPNGKSPKNSSASSAASALPH